MILEHCDRCCTLTDSNRDGSCKQCRQPRNPPAAAQAPMQPGGPRWIGELAIPGSP